MRLRTLRLCHASACAVAVVLTSACGGTTSHAGHDMGGRATTPTKTVDLKMTEFAFVPSTLTVAKGTTVRLRFANEGTIVHEALVGDDKAQAAHEEMMASGDDHAMHDSGATAQVQPGEAAELTYTFATVGTVLIGCHEPGHYKNGMKATVTVT